MQATVVANKNRGKATVLFTRLARCAYLLLGASTNIFPEQIAYVTLLLKQHYHSRRKESPTGTIATTNSGSRIARQRTINLYQVYVA